MGLHPQEKGPQMTPTLKQLVAQATPGPWQVYREPHSGKESAMLSISELTLSTPNFCGEVFMLSAPNGLCPALTGCGKDSDANAQLIARLDPQTVLAVAEALEAITHPDGLSSQRIRTNLEACRHALALLNGETK
jgi:hypothetical protein